RRAAARRRRPGRRRRAQAGARQRRLRRDPGTAWRSAVGAALAPRLGPMSRVSSRGRGASAAPRRGIAMRILPGLSLLATALLVGCVSVNTQGDPARAGFGPPPNDSLNATVWYQLSAERDLIYAQ